MQFVIQSIDGVEIKKDDFMGISGGKIVISKASLEEVMKTLMHR